ncbi:hypothetical protein OF001_U410008 [Pseudomonas sp. OF001]|nr:hypothetical protein OF001_U410008 [Pseudomonas sp. OF001]
MSEISFAMANGIDIVVAIIMANLIYFI